MAALGITLSISGCGERPDCSCQTNPCRDGQLENLGVPATSLLGTYEGTTLSGMLPPEARLMAAKVFYDLLTNGNQNDQLTWYVGQRPLEDNKLLAKSRRPSKLDVAYTGRIEVLPPTYVKGAMCRKFEQDVTLHTKLYGRLTYKSRGEACRRMAGSWKVTQDHQYK